MKVKNISFPYPVLGNEDDVNGNFDVRFFQTLRRDKIQLRLNFSLENKTLEKLLKKKKVAFSAEVECSNTFFRKVFISEEQVKTFEFPSSNVRELVTVKFYIRALEDISDYVNDDCHEDYNGFEFEVSRGDILAMGGVTSFIADKNFDPLKPVISSFIAIRKGHDKDGPMYAEYDNPEKIVIMLSQSDWDKYSDIKPKRWVVGMLHSAIVLPVLIEAITLVHQDNSEYRDNHWFNRLQVILQQQNLPDDDPLPSAQKILSLPVTRAMDGVIEREDEDVFDD